MKQNKYAILITAVLSSTSAFGQIIDPKEPSLVEILYSKTVLIDTIGRNSKTEDNMILRIGETSSMFYPEKRMLIDSLNYHFNNAGYDMIADAMIRGEAVSNVTGWEDEYLFRNIHENETFVCRRFASYNMGYKEETELPKWTIKSNCTRLILGYECINATCNYRGREWEVWFAPEIPLKEGPWKLAGLPGVVLRATDKNEQYVYEAKSVRIKSDSKVGIFLYHRRHIDMMKDRKSYLTALYHLILKGKFMNEVSVYSNFKTTVKDRIPHYDFEETDYPHD